MPLATLIIATAETAKMIKGKITCHVGISTNAIRTGNKTGDVNGTKEPMVTARFSGDPKLITAIKYPVNSGIIAGSCAP